MEMLDHALEYAKRGWPVFPIAPATKKPYPGSHGFKDAATNEILVTRMWDEHPDADIGMATGKDAGIWALDVDGTDGAQSLTEMETEFGAIPETLEARTGSGGRHLIFLWPAAVEREIRNKQELLGHKGIDIRGEGGYIVLAPSKHPSGGVYSWPYGSETPIADIPGKWLEAIAPIKRRIAPWERTENAPPPQQAPPSPGRGPVCSTPVTDRARRYLAECEPAVQGQGGHDKLLWAARAMVIGFQLDDDTAISLLWSEFNPRCVPPWDQGGPERKDFERKVTQARQTPGEKPRGWLLDEYGLRSGADVLASIAAGNRFAEAILARHARPGGQVGDGGPEIPERQGFPVEHFPPRLADYCHQVSESHVVDPSFVALPMLAVAGTAMGNAWRLKLKKGFSVPPLLWVGLVAPSGSNKSGPLNEVLGALKKHVPTEMVQNAMLNPQGRLVVSDATLEAVISRLAESHRGLLVFRDELAGWAKSFNAYKKSGGDEQAWLEFWGAKSYHLDRKTNNEQVFIPAAAVSILGGIQPSVLAECFDPGKFASGLVPRVLVACPEARDMYWSEVEVGDEASECWTDAIIWLRTRPFQNMDPNTGQYQPHELELTPGAKDIYVSFFESMTRMIRETSNEHAQAFASKARVMAARLILIHRGLALADVRPETITAPVGVDSAAAGVAWMQWCLAEQMRIYGFAAEEHDRQQATYLATFIRERGGTATVREVQRYNSRRFKTVNDAMVAMNEMVTLGLARWIVPDKKLELI